MIKVQLVVTGEIKEVTKNEAFGLVDSGKAKIYVEGMEAVKTEELTTKPDELVYPHRMMKVGQGKRYKIK